MDTTRGTEDGPAFSITELQSMPAAVVKNTIAKQATLNSDVQESADDGDIYDQMPPPATAVVALERWNFPKMNRWRVLATFSSVFTDPLSLSSENFGSDSCQRLL